MKTPILTAALVCCLSFAVPITSFAQAPKKDEKKAPAPKSATELAYDEYVKVRNAATAKREQANFQALITEGVKFIVAYPATSRTNEVVNFLGGGYPLGIDGKRPELKMQYIAMLKFEVSNQKYKDGITDPVKAAIFALDAAATEFEARMSPREGVPTYREKIDELAQTPGGGRFLADREKSYAHLLMMMSQMPKAEAQLKTLSTHKEKSVADMAKAELAQLGVRKAPLDFTAPGLDGKPVNIASLRGKIVIFFSWSVNNKSSTDALEKLNRYASDNRKKGIELVTLSLDKEEDRAKVQKHVKDIGLKFPVIFDGQQGKGEVASKLLATSSSRLYLISPEGVVQAGNSGGLLAINYGTSSGELGRLDADVGKFLPKKK